jgi:hypothetical protein
MSGTAASTRSAWFFAAAVILIDGGPGPPLGFFLRNPPLLITFGDVIGLALLLVGVFRFATTRHGIPP